MRCGHLGAATDASFNSFNFWRSPPVLIDSDDEASEAGSRDGRAVRSGGHAKGASSGGGGGASTLGDAEPGYF